MSENVESKTWNLQLAEWYKSNGVPISEIERRGIPGSSFYDYVHGKTKSLDKLSPERLRALYELTGLEIFNRESTRAEIAKPIKVSDADYASVEAISNIIQAAKGGIDKIVEAAISQLSANQKLKLGLLKSQQYTGNQRVDAIMQLLDILSEEVDYFRTAPEEEQNVLVERLQKEPESYSYLTQMLNIIYSGKQLNSWMLMAQPPSKVKRLIKK